MQRYKAHPSGHHYFELVEKGERDAIVGKLDAVVWRGDFARLAPQLARAGQRLADGLKIRCLAAVDFYPPHGKLQLHVREIDPAFTLGDLARRRQETLAALAAEGLLERNKALELAALPLTVALVTSQGSAAYHDFLATLRESGYGFRVLFVHSAVQGTEAEAALVSALALAGESPCDAIALVRGGGAKSDLAVFDSRAVAEAVARAAKPVLTGLGHEIDESVSDLAAHRSFKTPTKVAEHLVAMLSGAELAADRVRERLRRQARLLLAEAAARLARGERRGAQAARRLERLTARLDGLAVALGRSAGGRLRRAAAERSRVVERLGRLAPLSVERADRAPRALAERLASGARGRLAAVDGRLAGWRRLVDGLAPSRTLRRGFSVTRGSDGRVLRDATAVAAGERIASELARGTIVSRVEEP